jgi:hypothetical protein
MLVAHSYLCVQQRTPHQVVLQCLSFDVPTYLLTINRTQHQVVLGDVQQRHNAREPSGVSEGDGTRDSKFLHGRQNMEPTRRAKSRVWVEGDLRRIEY